MRQARFASPSATDDVSTSFTAVSSSFKSFAAKSSSVESVNLSSSSESYAIISCAGGDDSSRGTSRLLRDVPGNRESEEDVPCCRSGGAASVYDVGDTVAGGGVAVVVMGGGC